MGHVLHQAQFPPPPPHFGYKQEGGGGGGGLGGSGGRGANVFQSFQISPASLLPAPSSSQQQQQQQAVSANGGGGDPMPPLAPNLYAQLQQESTSTIPLIGASEEKFMNVFLAELNAFLPIADKDMLLSSLANLRANGERALPPSTLIPLHASLPPETAESMENVQLKNAHNAIVWAGIAIGAMLQGETGNMERYTTLAWLSMKECFDFPSPATVSAYIMMAFVYMMFGELDRFRRYCSMAEGIASALGPTLSNEMEVTLLYVRVGQNPDGKLYLQGMQMPTFLLVLSTSLFPFSGATPLHTHLGFGVCISVLVTLPSPPSLPPNTVRILESQWEEMSTMDIPTECAHLQMIYLVTRAKLYLLHNRYRGDACERQGLPRIPVDFDRVIPDLEMADCLLSMGPATSAATAVGFVRSMRGIFKFIKSRGKDIQEALATMQPVLNHAMRCPGMVKILPNFHFFHVMAMLLFVAGRKETYETVQGLTGTSWGTCASVPLWGSSLDDICDHPLCAAALIMTHEGRRRRLASMNAVEIGNGGGEVGGGVGQEHLTDLLTPQRLAQQQQQHQLQQQQLLQLQQQQQQRQRQEQHLHLPPTGQQQQQQFHQHFHQRRRQHLQQVLQQQEPGQELVAPKEDMTGVLEELSLEEIEGMFIGGSDFSTHEVF